MGRNCLISFMIKINPIPFAMQSLWWKTETLSPNVSIHFHFLLDLFFTNPQIAKLYFWCYKISDGSNRRWNKPFEKKEEIEQNKGQLRWNAVGKLQRYPTSSGMKFPKMAPKGVVLVHQTTQKAGSFVITELGNSIRQKISRKIISDW